MVAVRGFDGMAFQAALTSAFISGSITSRLGLCDSKSLGDLDAREMVLEPSAARKAFQYLANAGAPPSW